MKSPIIGKPMSLLNEDQEDTRLSKERIEAKDTLSVNYEASNHKVIGRYDTRFHQLICDSCHFKMLSERNKEIIKVPQQHKKGILRNQVWVDTLRIHGVKSC